MGNPLNVETKDLNKAVEEVNALNFEGKNPIRVVGISNEQKALLFIAACNAIANSDESLLSDEVVEVFNALPKVSEIEALIDAKNADKKDKPKKEKKAKTPKEPKAPRVKKEKVLAEKSRYGHVKSAKSGQLDEELFIGGTVEEIMEKLEIPRNRLLGHAKHLRDNLNLTLIITADPDGNKMKDFYQVKEEGLPEQKLEKKKEVEETEE
jgi:hypothetical protein